jgi:protein O-GlcNAc transferase
MMPTSPAAATIDQALAHHQADRLEEAETLYRRILDTDPRHADALHLLGLIGHQYGRYQEASDLIMAAIEVKPDAIYYYNLGNVMQADNRHAAAAECFRLAIELRPDYVDAYNNVGNALRLAGDARAAVDAFCQAIALKPDNGQAYNNLANALFDLNEIPAALEAYRHAVALRPELPEPRSNLLRGSGSSRATAAKRSTTTPISPRPRATTKSSRGARRRGRTGSST